MTTVIAAVIAAIGLAAPGATLAHAAPEGGPSAVPLTPETVTQTNSPFLFNYTFNNRLQIAGGHYTLGGRVFVTVKLNNGAVMFSRWVTARSHPITPGGAIYVDTGLRAPCTSTGNNGYARAFDRTTQTWSPRLPVPVCTLYDDD
jgi:hypothetical protein